MKVILKKSVEDLWGDDGYGLLMFNPISRALTQCYLPQWSLSPLQSLLLKKLKTFQRMYLCLNVVCREKSNVVESISLEGRLTDDVEQMFRNYKVLWEVIAACMTEYFQSIGYRSIKCTTDEDIVCFVRRLEQDVPSVKEYFEIIEEECL